MWRVGRLILVLLVALVPRQIVTAIEIESTRCEHLIEPNGIDVAQPRLSWALRSDVRSDRQTAYRVLVATAPNLLTPGKADAWDSGKVAGDDCVLVPYAGRRLMSHERSYWTVQVWDHEDKPSDWSKPSVWLMGVLDGDEWDAEWLGLKVPKRVSHLSDAHWIWFPEGDPVNSAPAASRYFRREFQTADQSVRHAVLRITGDDHVEIFLNGRGLGGRSGAPSTKELDLSHLLSPGKNVLAVRGENRGSDPSPAGVIAWLGIEYADGSKQTVTSDASWVAEAVQRDGWNTKDFDASTWKPVRVLGEVGCEPWGPVRYAENRRLAARYLRREFSIAKPVEKAMVSWCGLGCSELHINGDRVGDQVMSPAMSQYPERAYYVTRDVTHLMRQGENALAATLGNGRFYAPRSEVYAKMPTFGPPMLLLRLTVSHPDGTTTVVTTDGKWRITDEGPIVANNEYDGEEYDARKELGTWKTAGYDDSSWRRPDRLPPPCKKLNAEPISPMRVVETIRPVAMNEPRPGVFIFDLGQNVAGWCRLRVQGPAGTVIRLRHAERLTDKGELYLANLRGAKATDRYTLKGGGVETWAPRFTLHGFRYVEMTGHPGKPTLEALEACVVHDDLQPVGEFACANETINRVYRNTRWGFRGNYRSVPLDCPQRGRTSGVARRPTGNGPERELLVQRRRVLRQVAARHPRLAEAVGQPSRRGARSLAELLGQRRLAQCFGAVARHPVRPVQRPPTDRAAVRMQRPLDRLHGRVPESGRVDRSRQLRRLVRPARVSRGDSLQGPPADHGPHLPSVGVFLLRHDEDAAVRDSPGAR